LHHFWSSGVPQGSGLGAVCWGFSQVRNRLEKSINLAHGLSRELTCKLLLIDADPAASVFKHF
jgi:hypothetical protein